jgi:hypothetical protein
VDESLRRGYRYREHHPLLEVAGQVTSDELLQGQGAHPAALPCPSLKVRLPTGRSGSPAIRKVIAEEGWDFYSIQSFPGLGDDYSATCFAQSMMLEDRVGYLAILTPDDRQIADRTD